jgi:GxxExxY protein
MEIEDPEYEYPDLSHRIIGYAMTAHSYLGNGFQEVIYRSVLVYEPQIAKLNVNREIEVEIPYKNMPDPIGIRRADFIVENLMQWKALSGMDEVRWAQGLNYFRAYRIIIGFLINFSEKSLNFKRFVSSPKPKLFKS